MSKNKTTKELFKMAYGAETVEEIQAFEIKKAEQKMLDHFAGLAMQGIIDHFGFMENTESIGIKAYEVAKYMIKARMEVIDEK